jgi:glycosyltransferase involved in cell wall biosynthesis
LTDKQLRLNWFSNAPWTSVGYGNQTRLFLPRIKKLGYHVSGTAFYGLQGGIGQYGDIQIYPNGRHPYGQDVIGASAAYDRANVVITLMDVWVVSPENIPPSIAWHPWFPIDCEPMPKMIYDKIAMSRKPITMSKFGKGLCDMVGKDAYYVPHGVETGVFRPIDRGAAIERLGLPKDKFIVGMVAANKGNPPRKSFFEQITAFAAFHAQKKDSILYLHTDDGTRGGETVNLVKFCEVMGLKTAYITDNKVPAGADVVFCDQFTNLLGLPDPYMVDVYNALDVMMLCSMGEGFGIPLIEAQACGCPVISGAWTAMDELIFSGRRIPKREADPVWNTYYETWQYRVHVEPLVDALLEMYELKGNQDYRSRARDGALAYDADRVTEKYWKPVLEDIEAQLFSPALPDTQLVKF